MSTTPQLTDDELRTRCNQQAAERAVEFIQAGRNLTDEKSTPTTFTDDRHADKGRPHRE